MAAFVAQDTVESRERSLHCRSGDLQQQQSPKCCRECWIHSNVYCGDVASVIICLSDDRSPPSLWINSHSFCISCEDVPKTCAMLMKSGVDVLCRRTVLLLIIILRMREKDLTASKVIVTGSNQGRWTKRYYRLKWNVN